MPAARPCPALVLLVLLAGLLAGCGRAVDAEEARVCRLIAAGLEGGAQRIEVLGVTGVARPASAARGAGSGVAFAYRLDGGDRAAGGAVAVRRSLVCLFDPASPSPSPAERLLAVETEAGPLSPARLYMLKRFWLDTAQGAFADPSPVTGAARAPEVPRPVAVLLQALVAGIPQTVLYALLAGAYALVYGLVGRINLAFGDLVVAGGYAALIGIMAAGGARSATAAVGMALALAVWAAALVSATAGRLVFEPLHGLRGQAALIASAGLALALAEAVRLAREGGPRSGPPILNEPVAIARAGDFLVAATPMAGLVALLGGAGVAILLLGLRRSRLGRDWRAAADDPLAAALMGVGPGRVHAATFAAAGLLVGIGGAIAALAYGSVAYASGLLVGLKALIAALLGGAGSVGGAIACGAALGILEAVWAAYLPVEHRESMLFVGLVLLLVLRPGGLFGTPDLEPRR